MFTGGRVSSGGMSSQEGEVEGVGVILKFGDLILMELSKG